MSEKTASIDLNDSELLKSWAEARGLPLQCEATELVCVGSDTVGREQQMTAACAERWKQMRDSAADDGVELLLVSAFRSIEHQRGIFARKLARGEALEEILCVNAAPGYSEHHSGRALDLGTPGCEGLTEDFEATPASAWLRGNAERFGFHLSYPRDNPFGIAYEPWHWALCE